MASRFSRRYYEGAKHKVHFCALTWPEALHNEMSHYDEYFKGLLLDPYLSMAKGR